MRENCPVCQKRWEKWWEDKNGNWWMVHHCEESQAIIAWDERTQMDITDKIVDPPPQFDGIV